jgi:regulator of sigma E protease
VGDVIEKLDGDRIYIFSDFSMLTERAGEGMMDVTVRRNGETVDLRLDMTRQDFEVDGETQHIFGLILAGTEEKTAGTLLKNAWYTAIDFARMVKMGLLDLLSGSAGMSDMSGPVGIVDTIQETGKSAETTSDGVMNVVYFCAFIAVNLAFMNMLPIPALDGGHIFLLLVTWVIESITKKKIDPKYEAYIHGAGLVVLLAFMVLVTFNDIVKLITG